MYPQTFYIIKDKIIQLVSQRRLRLPFKSHPQGRPLKIKEVDALTLALYQHTSTRATKKSVYDDFRDLLRCSYKTLVCAINRAATFALEVLFLLMRIGKKSGHIVKMTDATDLPVYLKKNADRHKAAKGLAEFGHSAKGWHYGLKMTMTRDLDGNLLGLRFISANANGRDLSRSINKDIEGVIVADAGYVSKQLESDMNVEGRHRVLIQPRKTMRKSALPRRLKLYKLRFKIEFDFRSMRLFHGLVTSLPRSANGYLANYLNAVCSFAVSK